MFSDGIVYGEISSDLDLQGYFGAKRSILGQKRAGPHNNFWRNGARATKFVFYVHFDMFSDGIVYGEIWPWPSRSFRGKMSILGQNGLVRSITFDRMELGGVISCTSFWQLRGLETREMRILYV